jgi:protein disulfide-isomerase-like protein
LLLDAPWCGHCKALEPKYEQLGKQFQSGGHTDVIIAKLDATANDYDRQKWSVSGYPTIFFKPAGKKATVYDGAREVDDMAAYIKKNAKTIQKKGGKKKAKKQE